MPDAGCRHRIESPTGYLQGHTARLHRLAQALTTGYINQAEYRQNRDWHIGLIMLNGQADNLITRRLWAQLWLPLGIERRELHTLPHKEEE